MSMNTSSDTHDGSLLDAAHRLDGAMSRIESLTARLLAKSEKLETRLDDVGHSDDDRARLAEALDESRGREEALQAAAQDASDALDSAIEDLRLVISEE